MEQGRLRPQSCPGSWAPDGPLAEARSLGWVRVRPLGLLNDHVRNAPLLNDLLETKQS